MRDEFGIFGRFNPEVWWENPTAYHDYMGRHRFNCCFRLADYWESYLGPNVWSRLMRRCGTLGASCTAFEGMPKSHQLPPCFQLWHFGVKLTEGSRLRDLTAAVEYLESYHGISEQGPYRVGPHPPWRGWLVHSDDWHAVYDANGKIVGEHFGVAAADRQARRLNRNQRAAA
jgi:hypothetical protein